MSDGGGSENMITGDTPDFEVQLIPSWIVFTAADNYRISQYARFKVKFSKILIKNVTFIVEF